MSIASQLDEFDRVEADDGYIGETSLHVKRPACVAIPEENQAMIKRC